MEAARVAAQVAKQAASQAAVNIELDSGGFSVGDNVFGKASAGGLEAWFACEVTSIRSHRYPPIGIKWRATADGKTDPLLLPSPLTAFVPASHLRTAAPA
eukprot:1620304-Prymnesium_polylepis.1